MRRRVWSSKEVLWLMIAGMSLSPVLAVAQAGGTPGGAKAPAFEVVTIKPNNSGLMGGTWGASSTGYRAKNVPLARVILQAYTGVPAVPVDRLKNAPSWVMNDMYDITGKADEATIEAMKGLMQAQQIALEAPMLRAMLEERCKLLVHTEPIEVPGYALVVGKHGSKLKESQPNEPVPARVAKFQGGWMMVPLQTEPDGRQSVTYLQITMAQLVGFIGMNVPVIDQTGLKGKYDFELTRADPGPSGADGAAQGPMPDVAHMFDWEAVGLEMKPIKVPVSSVVVDHIERPSEN